MQRESVTAAVPFPGGGPATAEPCPDCGGTGWKPGSRADGSPAVAVCDCRKVVRGPARLEDIGVPPDYAARMRFDAFDEIDAGRQSPKLAKATVRKWADAWPDVKSGLLLSGTAGVGKTHLAVAALRHILFERGIAAHARYEYVPKLLRDVQRVWNDPLLTDERRVAALARAEIVVLDQLGADTGWDERVQERFLYILNRCVHGGGVLICTTAFPREAPGNFRTLADQISERGVSLLREACRFVTIRGEDYRDKVITHRLGR